MTGKQRELFDYIRAYITANGGESPSFEEMRVSLGLASKSGVSRLVSALVSTGYLRQHKGRARCLEVLRLPGQSLPPYFTPPVPARSKPRIKAHDMAAHIAAQPWCSADMQTVLASLRELRT